MKDLKTPGLRALAARIATIREFHKKMIAAGLDKSYEAAHAQLALAYFETTATRQKMVAAGKLPPLPTLSQTAADQSYVTTLQRLCDGLENVLRSYAASPDPEKTAHSRPLG